MTHEHIRTLVRRANPVPDHRQLESVDSSALVVLDEWRKEMQTDEHQVIEERPGKAGRGLLIGIAAAAVVLLGGLVYVTSSGTEPMTPAPNAVPLPAGAKLDPGAYYADTDGVESTSPRGTFVVAGTGWESLEAGAAKWGDGDYVSLLVTEVEDVSSPGCGATSEPAATSAEDLAHQFAAAGFTIVEPLASVSAFGQNGYHLRVEVPSGCAGPAMVVWNGPVWGERYYQEAGQIEEYWLLDVEGTPVLVEASWFPESPEADLTDLTAVLDSLVITP
jgi:hypothetical protein